MSDARSVIRRYRSSMSRAPGRQMVDVCGAGSALSAATADTLDSMAPRISRPGSHDSSNAATAATTAVRRRHRSRRQPRLPRLGEQRGVKELPARGRSALGCVVGIEVVKRVVVLVRIRWARNAVNTTGVVTQRCADRSSDRQHPERGEQVGDRSEFGQVAHSDGISARR